MSELRLTALPCARLNNSRRDCARHWRQHSPSWVCPCSSVSSRQTCESLLYPLSLTHTNSYAGEDAPKAVFPSAFATVPRADGSGDPSYIHGSSVNLYRPNAVHSPLLTDGLVSDWPALSRTLTHAFTDLMRLPTLEDWPLLVTEPSWVTKEQREKMCEVAFEEWKVPAYYGVDKSVMSA